MVNTIQRMFVGQLATILYNYANTEEFDTIQGGMAIREFADYTNISDYASQAMGWAVNTGLIQGSNNYLMPQGNATRAQVTAVLHRFYENVK